MSENWIIKTHLVPLHLMITPKEGSFISTPLRTPYGNFSTRVWWNHCHQKSYQPRGKHLAESRQWCIGLCRINSVAFLPLSPLQKKRCAAVTYFLTGIT